MNKQTEEFRKYAHQFVDWMADYMDTVDNFPVKSKVAPKEIYQQIEQQMPTQGESFDAIFADFKRIVLPGVTHWQSPNFYAYFQANSSIPSVLAEMLTATLGVQGMKWDTSPASTELEERMMEWLRDAMGLPKQWHGVIQDTGSSASLAAIITAREYKTNFQINEKGFAATDKLRLYCSDQTHSSVEKGAKIAGYGKEHVVKVPVDEKLALRPDALRTCIEADLAKGFIPTCVVVALGTTGTLAMDPLEEIAKIAREYDVWLHIDAAYAGSAFILPEYQYLLKGAELADSFFFNPHKWLFTNFDCSAYFVKDKDALINTFTILPEYLKSKTDSVVSNHCDWGVPLGRRFRSLKLWFVLRHYGLEGLQQKIRYHIALAEWLEKQINNANDFEMVIDRSMNLVCFRYAPMGTFTEETLNQLNERLLSSINQSGKLYLTHTKVNGIYTLRMSIGQTNVTHKHIEHAWNHISETARKLEVLQSN